MSDIYYLDAAAGAGKTYYMARKVAQNVKAGTSFIIVMPTTKMVDDVEVELKKNDPAIVVKKFYSDVIDGSVVSAAIDHLNNPPDVAHVVIMTYAGFDMLNYINSPENWFIIFDEAFSVFELLDPSLPNNHRLLTDCVTPICVGPDLGYSELDAIDKNRLRSLKENSCHDDVDKVYQPLARRIMSQEHLVYVLNSNYEALLRGDKGCNKLLMFVIRRPRLILKFAGCLIMAAQFKETLLFKIWNRMGVNFVEDENIKSDMGEVAHQNGHHVKFYYGYNKNWSKTLKDSKNNALTENFYEMGIKLIAGRQCLLLRNKSCKKTKHLLETGNFHALPAKSHGQNQFQKFDNVFVLAAYNLQRPAIKFLEVMFNLDEVSVKRAIMSYEIYQAVMRSSLRNRNSVTDKMVIVPDKATAEWLSSLFPGSTCQSLGLIQPTANRRGPKAIHSSSAEKQRVSREKLKAERIGFIKEIKLATEGNLRDLSLNGRDEYTLESIGNNVSFFRGTIIRNFKKKDPDRSLYLSDEGPFISDLRKRSKIRLKNKEDNEAISPACFRHIEGKDTVTAGVNVLFANGIWLDLDDTDMTPSDLSKIFPNLSFLVYSTFSHTKDVRRIRACFFTSDIMSNKQYRNIVRQIIHKIEAIGSYIKTFDPSRPYMKAHGIDPKYDASNKFYLPCKPGNGDAGIFKVYNGNGRSPLDVDDWLLNPIIPLEEEILAIASSTINSDHGELTPLQTHVAERALEKFRSAPKGQGHNMFFKMNRRLLHHGIRGHHWRLFMSQAVRCSRSKADRQKEMEQYMKDAA